MNRGAAYLLIALVLVFTAFGSGFATVTNGFNIGVQSSVLLLLALPMTLVIMSEGLDLSMGAVLSLAGVVLATLLMNGRSLPAASVAAIAVGALFGFANGLLVVGLGIPPFVATLGTLGIAQGLALVITGGQSVVGVGDALPALYESRPLGLPFSIVIALAAFLVFRFTFRHTPFGAYVSAIGGNRESLVLAGGKGNRYHLGIYVPAGVLGGVAALLLTGRMSSGAPTPP